jgi:hypothetical protein
MGTERHVFMKDWIACSNFVNHSRFNSQHIVGDLDDHLMSIRMFILIMYEDIHRAPKTKDLDFLIIT